MINSAYLNKYYFGKNIIQIEIYEPLYRQYDAYVNKKQLKHAPFITMTPNIPNSMHINSDNTVLLDSKAMIDERVFDLILKTHVLKMMVKHNKLPNFNDNNIIYLQSTRHTPSLNNKISISKYINIVLLHNISNDKCIYT